MQHVLCKAGATLGLAALLVGCVDDEPEWNQYNAETDSVEIEVGSESAGADVSVTLLSSTGLVELGTATVSPGSGPIGTEHTVTIEISEDYANDVGRATVRTDSGDRGEDEYALESDSAGEGLYARTLVSVGDAGEVRTDVLTFRLWYDANQDTGN